MAARTPGGHRRTGKRTEGDPSKLRRERQRRAAEMDSCASEVPCGWCYLCRPDPYDEEDERA